MSALPPRARALGVIGCHACGLVCAAAPLPPPACPRCGAPLHRRRPDAITRAWALLAAALVLYIPANLLPVLHTRRLADTADSTIMRGVIEFWHEGSWGIAALIFIASIAVPCTKFMVLSLLLWTSQKRSRWAMVERTRLYRLLELIGYWSMLDVLVVAIVSALVQFGTLSVSEPRIGIFFFGLVVLLTMLSAMSFDPRLIWDADDHE